MLPAALRVIRGDLRSRPLHTALTGLVVAFALGALVVTLHGRVTLDDPYDRLFRATDGAHVTAISQSRADLTRIAALPGVAAAEGPRPLVRVPVRFGDEGDTLGLIGLPRTRARVERPLILDGRAARGPGEVVLHREFARGHGIAVGDAIAAGVGTTRRDLRVVGIGAAAGSTDGGWGDPADVLGLATQEQPLQFGLGLRLADPASAKAFALRAADTAPDGSVRTLDWRTQRKERTDDARRLLTILQTTTVLALLAAAFTLATAIGGRVLAQRRQIGLLRAIGLTPLQVTGLLVAHYLVLAALAAPFGLAGGAFVAERLSASAADALGAPAHPPPSAALLAVALLVALVVVALATALPAWRAGRMPVQAALALGRGATSARASRVARLALRLRLPVVVGVGAKDAFAQRGRTILTVSSLGLAAALVATAMGFEATMDRLGSDPALRAQPYELRVESSLPPAEVDRQLARRGEVTAVARVREIVMTGPREVEIHARVLDGPLQAFPYAIRDGRAARAPGEVTLGRGALDALHARIGDRIALRAGGQPVSLRVVGRHVEPDDEGRGAVTGLSGLPAGTARLDDPYWGVRLSPGADPVATAAGLTREGRGRVDVERPIESLQREADDMRPVVYGTVALLMVIAALNLLTTLGLAIRERERDYAVLASVGATPRQVRSVVIAGGAALALPAAVLGLPLGAWIFMLVIGATDPADGPDVRTLPVWWSYPVAIAGAVALTAAISALASRAATRIRPAPALRAE
jgi:putative ABC transport system permease protein